MANTPSSTIDIHPVTYCGDASEYFALMSAFKHRVWLDSGKPQSNYGRFDILSAAPVEVYENATIDELKQAIEPYQLAKNLDALHDRATPFCGGLLGYFNYEHRHQAFAIEKSANNKSDEVASSFCGLYTWALIQDHECKESFLVFHPLCQAALKSEIISFFSTAESEIASETPKQCAVEVSAFQPDLTQAQYDQAFEKIHHYLEQGDTYQINFSQRFQAQFKGSSEDAYISLRKALPSPFSAYFEFGNDVVLSLSPERFIQVDENKQASTQPIKGTMPRGKNESEDKALAQGLVNSEKNRAENLMIVDLLRNDFGQACVPGSVRTPKLFDLESYANVHHLVSTVTGLVREEVHPLDFFYQCFPGGSITGAPKKRAMQIIDELESTPRNIYCGSVFYLSADGKMDSSITIRTLLLKDETIYCWGGGGIVYDSNAKDEYQESLQKVGLLMRTLQS